MSHPLRGQPDAGDPEEQLGWVKAILKSGLHSSYDQPDTAAVPAQFDRVIEALAEKLPPVAEHLLEAREDILAFTGFPPEIRRQIWSNNANERLYREIRRRTDVVGIFPDRPSSSDWSARCWPNKTTNGPKAAADGSEHGLPTSPWVPVRGIDDPRTVHTVRKG